MKINIQNMGGMSKKPNDNNRQLNKKCGQRYKQQAFERWVNTTGQ